MVISGEANMQTGHLSLQMKQGASSLHVKSQLRHFLESRIALMNVSLHRLLIGVSGIGETLMQQSSLAPRQIERLFYCHCYGACYPDSGYGAWKDLNSIR